MIATTDKQSKQLYNQFLLYMKNSHSSNLPTNTQILYKQLYSELSKKNKHKRNTIIVGLKNREQKIKNIANYQIIEDGQCEGSTMKSSIAKRNKSACLIRSMDNSGNVMSSSKMKGTCKFKKIETIRDYEEMKKDIIRSQSPTIFKDFSGEFLDINKQNPIHDRILLQEHQQRQLGSEISNYKKSINQLRKDLQEVKYQIKKIEIKENKFQEAHHLANNINQNTQQVILINNKNYQKMIEDHQATVSELKKTKAKIKKQLQEAQKEYHRRKKEHSVKLGKYLNSFEPYEITENKSNMGYSSFINFNSKTASPKKLQNRADFKDRQSFLISLSQLLDLLQLKQKQYDELKHLSCTRIRSKPVNIEALTPERANWMQQIEQFEEVYEVRVESCFQIIQKLYRKIKESNENLEKVIYQKQMIRNDCSEEFKEIEQKGKMEIQEYLEGFYGDSIKKLQQSTIKKTKDVNCNSKSCILCMELISSLLVKFQYIFKLFFMMNIDKKKFNEHLLNLQSILRKKNYSCELGNSRNQQLNGQNSPLVTAHQTINQTQVKDIIQNYLMKKEKSDYGSNRNANSRMLEEYLMILFNDIRIPLYCRKQIVLEEVNFSELEADWQGQIVKIIANIRQECEYTYIEKFKHGFSSLIECMRCIKKLKTGSFYDKHRLNSNKAITNMENPVIPITITPQIKLVRQSIDDEEQDECDVGLLGKAVLSYLSSRSEKNDDRIHVWRDEAKKNPSQMVRQLYEIRNQNNNKFKVLDFRISRNQFMPRQFSIRNLTKENRGEDKKSMMEIKSQRNMQLQSAKEVKNTKQQCSKLKKKIEFNNQLQDNFLIK